MCDSGGGLFTQDTTIAKQFCWSPITYYYYYSVYNGRAILFGACDYVEDFFFFLLFIYFVPSFLSSSVFQYHHQHLILFIFSFVVQCCLSFLHSHPSGFHFFSLFFCRAAIFFRLLYTEQTKVIMTRKMVDTSKCNLLEGFFFLFSLLSSRSWLPLSSSHKVTRTI